MYKVTIRIEEIHKKKETLKGKYIISRSNYGFAYIAGIPCKVISDPYPGSNDVTKKKEKRMTVQSCLTGFTYEIPYSPEWMDVYDDFHGVLGQCRDLLERGYYFLENPSEKTTRQIVGKDYFPRDNSYSKDFDGNWFPVTGKTVTILSVPFEEETEFGKKRFVLVAKENGEIGRCMFMEWRLRP